MADDRRFLGLPIWRWDGISGFAAACGLGVILLTAVAGVYQLHVHAEAARAQATLDLLDLWEERGYLAHYQDLSTRFDAVVDVVPPADVEAARADPVISAKFYERVTDRVLAEPEARAAFDALIYFFQRLHICVEARLCSRDATAQFFDGPMEGFARTFAAEIIKRRRAQPDYAEALKAWR